MQIQLTNPAGTVALAALPPLSLYVHIPWCVRKCPYCDFNSHELKAPHTRSPPLTAERETVSIEPELERQYLSALIADLETALPQVWGRPVHTVFFGGGTPSLLSAQTLDELLSAIRARLPLAPDAEITLEANPGTFEAQKFVDFRTAGVNRLSIGIQSFDPAHLKALGRIHDGAQARAAIEIAQASFDNFNLDLMYALPGQTVAQTLADIDTAIGFGPEHISAYHLTIEPNTYFYRHPPQVPDQDVAADMQEAIEARLASAGYRHYETSAFARPGREARHNLNYWTFGDYLGIGAGAHSKLSFADRILRQMRVKHPRDYLEKMAAGVPVQQEQRLAAEELPFEFMMNALRLIDGFELRLFAERTGLPVHVLREALGAAERSGLIEQDHLRVRPTLRGQRFLNDLLQIFLKDSAMT
ncbi:MAG TPA: radical SAM family heme chaperone HemW [Burkholderiales bacterium]|jgi:oxygen-independent coproporphyrinogen-3 oxidase|nr:radical SAM family heme chaperone HemW [Burkholderiales bacterium]